MSPISADGDRLQRLEQLVPQCESIRQGSEYGDALAQATSEVAKVADLPTRLLGLKPALRVLGRSQHLISQDVLPELEKLEAAGHVLEQSINTEALKEVRFSVKDIEEALSRLESHVSKAWAAMVHAEFLRPQRLGKVLAEIQDTKATGLELLKWAKTALGASDAHIPTADAVGQFEEAKKELPSRLKELKKLGVDAPVTSFLLAVASSQATLEDLPTQVLDWLRAKNAQSRFRVELT